MDSMTAVEALTQVDPGFQELCKTLLGDAVEPAEVWAFLYGSEPVVKMNPVSSDVAPNSGLKNVAVRPQGNTVLTKKGALVRASKISNSATSGASSNSGVSVASGIGVNPPKPGSSNQAGYSVDKADDDDTFGVTWAGEFSKMDEDKRQVFGWASVVELDGKPVVDRQGDWITPDEIEKAAYKYVTDSRKGGHQHRRDGESPFHASDMIESIVFTPEKIEKMGLPDDFPVGWWVGYKVHDDNTWDLVKKGDVTGFSIHGKGKRRPVAEVDV